jgi:hypothetical protein
VFATFIITIALASIARIALMTVFVLTQRMLWNIKPTPKNYSTTACGCR